MRWGFVEVEAAGAVEGLMGVAEVCSGGEERVFEVVVAGSVDGEAPEVGGAAVAQSAELDHGCVRVASVDVGEVGSEAHVDAGEFGPAVSGVVGETDSEPVLG